MSKINLLAICLVLMSFLPACASPLAVTSVPRLVALISPENAGQVYEVAYSPDGLLLAAASSHGIYLYDTETLAQRRFIGSDRHALSVAFSPDGQTLASGFSTTAPTQSDCGESPTATLSPSSKVTSTT